MLFSRKCYFIIVFYFSFVSKGYSQVQIVSSVYDEIANIYSDALYDKEIYKPPFNVVNDFRPFFKNEGFSKATVRFKDINYFEILAVYNVFEDRLILKHSEAPGIPLLIVEPKDVPYFSIFGNSFEYLDIGIIEPGYFEIISSNKQFRVIKKHLKKKLKKTDAKIAYYDFKDKAVYYIKTSNAPYIKLKSIKTLIRVFPNFKSILLDIEDELKALKKEKSDYYIEQLLNRFENAINLRSKK